MQSGKKPPIAFGQWPTGTISIFVFKASVEFYGKSVNCQCVADFFSSNSAIDGRAVAIKSHTYAENNCAASYCHWGRESPITRAS
jgi:hypothetical protein